MADTQRHSLCRLLSNSSAGTDNFADNTTTRLSTEFKTDKSGEVVTSKFSSLPNEGDEKPAHMLIEQRDTSDRCKLNTVYEKRDNSEERQQKHHTVGYQNSVAETALAKREIVRTSCDSRSSCMGNFLNDRSSVSYKQETVTKTNSTLECCRTCDTGYTKQNGRDGLGEWHCKVHNVHNYAELGETERCFQRCKQCACQHTNNEVNRSCEINEHAEGAGEVDSTLFRDRDKIINDFQLKDMLAVRSVQRKLEDEYKDVSSLKKKYASLQKLFMLLSVVIILLIMCVVAILPVIMMTVRMGQPSEENIKQMVTDALQTSKILDNIKRITYCVKCSDVPVALSGFFRRALRTDECCVKSMLELTKQLMEHHDQGYKEFDFKLKDLGLRAIQSNCTRNSNGTRLHLDIHSQIEKNKNLISVLLGRRRSAIHLKSEGTRMFESSLHPNWVIAEEHIISVEEGKYIKIKSGGMYFIYSSLRFKRGYCNPGRSFGYEIKTEHGFNVASVKQECNNRTNRFEQDLKFQGLHAFGAGSYLYIEIDSTSQNLLHDDSSDAHYFGVFEV